MAFFGQMDVIANSTGKNLHWILNNLSVYGAALKFKPVSLFKHRKEYLLIVRYLRIPHENLQCLYENLLSNNFCKMAVLKKI